MVLMIQLISKFNVGIQAASEGRLEEKESLGSDIDTDVAEEVTYEMGQE